MISKREIYDKFMVAFKDLAKFIGVKELVTVKFDEELDSACADFIYNDILYSFGAYACKTVNGIDYIKICLSVPHMGDVEIDVTNPNHLMLLLLLNEYNSTDYYFSLYNKLGVSIDRIIRADNLDDYNELLVCLNEIAEAIVHNAEIINNVIYNGMPAREAFFKETLDILELDLDNSRFDILKGLLTGEINPDESEELLNDLDDEEDDDLDDDEEDEEE